MAVGYATLTVDGHSLRVGFKNLKISFVFAVWPFQNSNFPFHSVLPYKSKM
jgi:hypothetical protein